MDHPILFQLSFRFLNYLIVKLLVHLGELLDVNDALEHGGVEVSIPHVGEVGPSRHHLLSAIAHHLSKFSQDLHGLGLQALAEAGI